MAFDYKLMTNGFVQMTTPSSSLYMNSSPTASYVRQMIFYNVSGSTQNVQLWLAPSGTSSPMTDGAKFLSYGLSGSATFIMDFGVPGLIMSCSGMAIYGATSNANGVNVLITGGTE